jgi:hypothetical protein
MDILRPGPDGPNAQASAKPGHSSVHLDDGRAFVPCHLHRLHHGYQAWSWDGWDPDEIYDDELEELWS